MNNQHNPEPHNQEDTAGAGSSSSEIPVSAEAMVERPGNPESPESGSLSSRDGEANSRHWLRALGDTLESIDQWCTLSRFGRLFGLYHVCSFLVPLPFKVRDIILTKRLFLIVKESERFYSLHRDSGRPDHVRHHGVHCSCQCEESLQKDQPHIFCNECT